jgi:hypothetical protein
MDDEHHEFDRWWRPLRRVVTFGLGVAVILDALIDNVPGVGRLIVGLVMIGVLPLDDLLQLARRDRKGP